MINAHRCNDCGKKFTRPSNLARHRVVHSKEKPFMCNICSMRFTQKGSMHRHSLLHSGEKSFKCTKCSMRFSQHSNLKTHMRRVHPRNLDVTNKFPCTECSCVFTKLNSLNRHSAKLHSSKQRSTATDNDNDEDSDCSFDKVMAQLQNLQSGMLPAATSSSDTTLIHSCRPQNEYAASEKIKRVEKKSSIVKIMDNLNLEQVKSSIAVNRIKDGSKTRFVCDFCQKSFKRPYELMRHRRIHTKDKPHQCGICSRSFIVKSNLQAHLRIHGKEQNRLTNCYQCPECFATFSSLRQLNLHAKTHKDIKVFCCKVCNKRFANTNNLRSHEKLHQKKATYVTLLGRLNEIGIENGVALEKNVNDERKFQCSICGLKFKRLVHLTQHEINHSGIKPYECLTCHKRFSVRGSLNIHQKIVHAGRKTKICNLCDSAFRSNTELKRHQAVHSTKRTIACPYCDKKFKTKGTCKVHILTHFKLLKNSNAKGFSSQDGCLVIPIELEATETEATESEPIELSPTELNANVLENDVMFINIGENLSQLEVGSQTVEDSTMSRSLDQQSGISKFIELDELLRNDLSNAWPQTITVETSENLPVVKNMKAAYSDFVQSKQNVKLHVCETCNRAFKKPIDLRRHIRTHTKERPFRCDVCQESFRLKCTLERHQEIHKEKRIKFDCRVCGKTYASQNVLNVHIRIHTNERPYKCDYCDKTFRTTGHKDAHIKMHLKIPRKSNSRKRVSKKLEPAVLSVEPSDA